MGSVHFPALGLIVQLCLLLLNCLVCPVSEVPGQFGIACLGHVDGVAAPPLGELLLLAGRAVQVHQGAGVDDGKVQDSLAEGQIPYTVVCLRQCLAHGPDILSCPKVLQVSIA